MMARVTGPLMSLDASGTLAKTLTFAKWKGRSYVRTRTIPANPQSVMQIAMRAGIKGAALMWAGQSAANKLLWADEVGARAISGFNVFTSIGQRALRNGFAYMEVPGGDLSDTPTAPSNAAATDYGQDVAITWTDATVGNPYTVHIHRSPTGTFTPGISNLIAVFPLAVQVHLDIGKAGTTYYYDIASGGIDGGVGTPAGEFDNS